MINNNFKKILKCFFTFGNINVNDLKLIGLDGSRIHSDESVTTYVWPLLSTPLYTIINSDGIHLENFDGGGVCMGFGSGSKQFSLEDYKLETIIDDLSYQSSSAETTEEGYTVITSAKNNTSTDIIVSEVGIFFRGIENYEPGPFFMLTRNVLETPITIKPNETKTFTVTINF